MYHVIVAHFHHLLNEGMPIPVQTGAQVPFLIITYATIGKLYHLNKSFVYCQFLIIIGLVIVMSEALGDNSVFSLLMVATVWEADQFYAVFCQHRISKFYFPL
jgi:hypothetical protein